MSGHENAWMALGVVSMLLGGKRSDQSRISTKETDRKKAQRLADEYEKAPKTKRSLRQAQAVLDRIEPLGSLSLKFGTSVEFRLNLQSLYELRLAQEKAGKSIKTLPTLKQREAVHA